MQKFKKIEHYQLMQILGKGANGYVYKGLNTINGTLVALKQLFIGKSQVKSIKTELQLLKNLDNPRIVKFIDAIQKQNKIYLVLEFMEGGSLAALVKKSPLQQEVIKLYVKQILHGLMFLHKQKVIHRDIKGANILLTKSGQIKLADFGVALRLSDNQKTISAAGSPYWMAPQIISSNGEQPTVKSDIWSLGCTVIQLLTGNPPYYDLMQFPALFRIVQDAHPPIPQCSKQCKQFLLACFRKNCNERPGAEDLLKHIWLKDVKLQATNKILNLQSQLSIKIDLALKPIINYQQLDKILQKTHNSVLICRNKYFTMISYDTRYPNSAKSNFITNLIHFDYNCIMYIFQNGVISQELDKFACKFQPNQQACDLCSNIMFSLFDAFNKCVKQFQLQSGSNQIKLITTLQTLELLMIQKGFASIVKLYHFYNKYKKLQISSKLLENLISFIQKIHNSKSSQQILQILILITKQFEQTGDLKQLLTLCVNVGKQQSKAINISLLLIQKISQCFNLIAQVRPNFRKYIRFFIFQFIKSGFKCNSDEILLLKLTCLKKLINDQFCKSQLQIDGFVLYLNQYFEGVCQNMQNASLNIIYQIVAITNIFIQTNKQEYNKNRVMQMSRYEIPQKLQKICEYVTRQINKTSKRQQQNPLVLQLNCLIIIFRNFII